MAVLWTYLADTDSKLGTFQDLLGRTNLFLDIVNRRFINKTITADAEKGIKVITDSTGDTLEPSDLSSGEQHELVLFYDLLFNTSPGTLVLIEEPEISLHVAWQQAFLGDIEAVTRLVPVRFVIATHSPQIIHKSWSRTVMLGPVQPEVF